MREAVRKKFTQAIVMLLMFAVLAPLLPIQTAEAATARYQQNGTFLATGSPLLNPNFSSDAWNKWEIVAWGVFLSNFVVPMADDYESAFSTGSSEGSRGSGYKALDFSGTRDTANASVLENFLQFAIDQQNAQMKPLMVTYTYLGEDGQFYEKDSVAGYSRVPTDKDPSKTANIAVTGESPANFRDILLVDTRSTSADILAGVLNGDNGGWFTGSDKDDNGWPFGWGWFGSGEPDDIFGGNKKTLWGTDIALLRTQDTAAAVGSSIGIVAKLPTIWLKGADGNYVKVWDMSDPWDFQVSINMLLKEVNSDATYDEGLGTESVVDVALRNVNTAFKSGAPLFMDSFGNIVINLNGAPVVVIPAAYNKHITTEPIVNLVTSFFLTGTSSKMSREDFIKLGKSTVMSGWWWMFNDNETADDGWTDYGVGTAALGWRGHALPMNAVALYFDTDSLFGSLYRDVQDPNSSLTTDTNAKVAYGSVDLHPLVTTIIGVLDLEIHGNRQFNVNNDARMITPKLELSGISKASSLGKNYSGSSATITDEGTASLIVMSTYSHVIVNMLPSTATEQATEYVSEITWREDITPIFGEPVVVPVALASGLNSGKKVSWNYLARDFVSYYGTTYWSKYRGQELRRLAEYGGAVDVLNDGKVKTYQDLTGALMRSESNTATDAIISHTSTAQMSYFMRLGSMATETANGWFDSNSFVWREPSYVSDTLVDTGWGNGTGDQYKYLTKRWIKAYPINPILSEIANYLGMRGDSEFAAAAAPYLYFSYLKIYGVDKVKSLTLNKNPTKFNENIYDAAGGPLFEFDPTANTGLKSDEEMAREVSIYTWQLLSPTHGGEYKRQLMSSLVGNFVYEQYNRTVFGGSLEYRSGGVQTTVTRSQTGFLRFPSLEDNMFTGWFYSEYATIALWLLAIGLVFIVIFGVFRRRKVVWFFISVVLLVACVVVIPFTNDIASSSMDGLVSNILKDKTTMWSITEMLANERAEQDFLSSGLDSEAAQIAQRIMRDLSVVYTDRALMLRQDVSKKVISLGNYSELQQFASTRWALPSLLRQFSADDGSTNYMYVPLLDVADNAANIYWWYNPKDANSSGGISANDTQASYSYKTNKGLGAVNIPSGIGDGSDNGMITESELKAYYPDYHFTVLDYRASLSTSDILKASYRSVTKSVGSVEVAIDSTSPPTTSSGVFIPIHDFIYMYMSNTFAGTEESGMFSPLIPLPERNAAPADWYNRYVWGDPDLLDEPVTVGGVNSYRAKIQSGMPTALTDVDLTSIWGNGVAYGFNRGLSVTSGLVTYTHKIAHDEVVQLAQQYQRDARDTMMAEFGYLWSTESLYPYFYALVKETMRVSSQLDYVTGRHDPALPVRWDSESSRLGVMANALSGVVHETAFYGAQRSNFMFQTGITWADIPDGVIKPGVASTSPSNSDWHFTGYGRDVLDLESMFYNVVPYMYQMTMLTGGLTGDSENDMGLFGLREFSDNDYRTYKGLPHSFLYRCNWVNKIVEAPEYNPTSDSMSNRIGYWAGGTIGGTKEYAYVYMTYFPDAYTAAGRDMVFSEAQMMMMGLDESDLTLFELKCVRLNKSVSTKWTALLNYINVPGLTAEVLVRQMSVDALTEFNAIFTPSGLGNSAYSLYPSNVDLRALSFDTVMRVILLNATKNSNYFNVDAMEATILEYDVLTGVLLLITAWVCAYGVTLFRAFFLAFLFLMGIYGVAKSVFAANDSKKATLFGYVVNIVLLFLMSLVYYFVFNVLMTGANDAAFVTTGLSGSSVSPGWALLVILAASILYIIGMWKMFRIALSSVISGTGDLGFGTYKDKAQAGIQKISNGIKDMRAGHSYESMSQTASSQGGSGSATAGTVEITQSGGSTGKKKRRGPNPESGAGSGSRALQGNESGKRGGRPATAMDDHETIDAITSRGGGVQSTPQQPAQDLQNYLPKDTSSGAGTKVSSGNNNKPTGK